MDCEKIKANGPWILVKPEPPKKQTDSGIYVPDGNLLERLGHVVAQVLSAGDGYYEKVGERDVFVRNEVSPGDRVVFRGHLKNANMVGRDGHCFLHARDLMGVLDGETMLDPALPYDN